LTLHKGEPGAYLETARPVKKVLEIVSCEGWTRNGLVFHRNLFRQLEPDKRERLPDL
jgi:hypothetical protein